MEYSRKGWAVEDKQYLKSRGRLPQWFLDQPGVWPGEGWWLDAFWNLSTCRKYPSPIPWDKIVDYADRAGLAADLHPSFVRVIRSLDDHLIKNSQVTTDG